MSTRRELLQASLGATLLGALPSSFAQTVDQVKIYYGFPAGSAGDSVARRVGEKLAGSTYTRSSAVVENRPGAGGRIALDVLKTASSDGSALGLTPFSCVSIYPHIYTRLSYSPLEFVPVSIAAVMHHGLAVGPLVPASVKSVKDFLAWAKANPQQASYGSPAAGSTPHFIGALLGMNNGVEMKHVPYRGSVPGVTDVVGGQIAAMVTPSGDFIPNHKAGKIRILATSGRQRSPFTPEGRAALVHSICHIEFNAINLALDAAWRFDGMPREFHLDWVRVAAEEAYHFGLLREHLASLGYAYGDFPAHDNLWAMCERTNGDIIARMALVPRTLEARGLDASPLIQERLRKVGTAPAMRAVEILDIILRDEIGHVAIGNRWYRWLCEREGLDPIAHYDVLATKYDAPRLHPPFNDLARRDAGFTEDELVRLNATPT